MRTSDALGVWYMDLWQCLMAQSRANTLKCQDQQRQQQYQFIAIAFHPFVSVAIHLLLVCSII
jgi:hypothetical protein